MRETKTEAKTIQDAVEKGLAELGLRRDQVEVVVVSEGKSGFLGIGAKKACVILREKRWGSESREGREGRGGRGRRGERGGGRRGERGGRRGERGDRGGDRSERSSAPRRPGRYGYEDARLPPQEESHREERHRDDRPRREDRKRSDRVYTDEPLAKEYSAMEHPQDAVEHAKEALLKLLSLMGMEATVTEAKMETSDNLLAIKFDCADSAVFTAENGRALQSLQFVLNSMVSRKREPHVALRLDTGGYWEKKEQEIASSVEQAVEEARRADRPFRLDPMPASMRKMVHNLIKTKYPDMETASEGEGRWRKVVVRRTEKPQEQASQDADQAQPEPQPEEQPEPRQEPQQQPAESAQPAETPAEQPEQQPSEQK